ncbi:hypothetical protein D3C73_986880 [compost metagenome]
MRVEQRFGVGGGKHLVGVVGDVHLFLAHQLPVEAVQAAVEHVQFVETHHPRCSWGRRVAAGIGQAAHAALTRQVGPHRRFIGIEVFKAGDGLARPQWRPIVGHADGPEHTFVTTAPRQIPGHLQIGARIVGQHVLAVGGGQVLVEAGVPRGPAPAQQVVPHGFYAIARDRERNAPGGAFGHGAGRAVHQLAAGGVGKGCVIHRLRCGSAAVGRVDVQPVAVGVLLQHRLDAWGQLVSVLRHVLRSDCQQRLVSGERVATLAAVLVSGVDLGVTAGPGGDTAVGIAGTLAAQWGQCGLERCRLLGGHRGKSAVGEQQRGTQGSEQGNDFIVVFHRVVLGQKVRLTVKAMKSRSLSDCSKV